MNDLKKLYSEKIKTAETSTYPLFILAGGLATRLGAFAQQRPKYLMEVGKNRVFADLHLKWVAQQGFKNVILCVGHLGDQIQKHCDDGSKWGLHLQYSYDDPQNSGKRLGTGGAVYQALRSYPVFTSAFALTYGDTLLTLNAAESLRLFCQNPNFDLLLYVYQNDLADHVCNAQLGERVSALGSWGEVFTLEYSKTLPKPEWSYIDYGFMWIRTAAFLDFVKELNQRSERVFQGNLSFDLADFQESVSKKKRLLGICAQKRFYEIGSPQALKEFQEIWPELVSE